MKWKYLIFCACVSLFMVACDKEDTLESVVDFSTPYVLEDDPNDPVAHKRYELYQQYAVSVFFKDTLSVKEIGKGYDGTPIYRYETLDYAWEFTNNSGANIKFVYLTEVEEQLKALDYVETYLSIISKSMRPFSILLVKEINLNDETPDYVDDGLRTLFIAGAENYEDEVAIKESCMAMVNSMVLKKVDQNEALKLQFTDVSGKNNWYFSNWKTHLGCTFSANMQLYFQMGGRLENAFDESKLQAIADDYMTSMYQSFMPAYAGANLAGNIDAVRATRDEFVRMAGNFGFISGETTYGSHNYSPRENQDLEAYVSAIISLGANGFAERYGASPLVMQKYKILADYIVEELGVNLDF